MSLGIKDNRIFFIAQHLSKGGAERVISILLNHLASRGYGVVLVLLYNEPIDYRLDESIEVRSLGWKRKCGILLHIKQWKELRNEIKNGCVIAFLFNAIMNTSLSTVFTQTKLVFSERNDPRRDPDTSWKRFMRNVCYLLADRVVLQTQDQYDYYKNEIRHKSCIIHNPVSGDLPYHDSSNCKKVIILVGRLEKQKNIKLCISAFWGFHKKYPDFQLHIYGEGEEKEELKRYISHLGLSGVAVLKGYTQNIHEKMKESYMYISSSNYEGISNAMLEAMAIGLPVVCTDCPAGGARLMIDNYRNGILVPVGNVEALETSMITVAEDEELRKKISLNAMSIRRDYSVESVGGKWERLLTELMSET